MHFRSNYRSCSLCRLMDGDEGRRNRSSRAASARTAEEIRPVKLEAARYVVVPILTALFGALATVGTAFVTETGFTKPRDVRVTPAAIPTIVGTLPDPEYDGVEMLKDVRIIDLRGRVPVPPEKKASDKISSATWVRYTSMKKLKEKNFVEFEFATTGAGIDARSLTHRYELITTKQPHFHGSVRVKPIVLKIDISNEPIGREFLILNEMTYWNAFTGEETDWAAMHRVQNEEAAMVVLFPENKPVKSHEFLQYKQGMQPEPFRGRHRSYVSENGLVLFWGPEDLKRDSVYQIRWRW